MKIKKLQHDLEEGLSSLARVDRLPSELDGLRHLAPGDLHPQVEFRYAGGRKIRDDAAARYFDPEPCEVLISFVSPEPSETALAGEPTDVPDAPGLSVRDLELIEALKRAEAMKRFVGLKWFRDQFMPQQGYAWAADQAQRSAVLRNATEQRLVLTSQVPNPHQPLRPVTAIRVNRSHPALAPSTPPRQRSRFNPISIRGGSMSDTVLDARR